jgi:hypothetical protein
LNKSSSPRFQILSGETFRVLKESKYSEHSEFLNHLCYCPVDRRAVYEPQVNLEDPPVGPQEEVDASPFEEENPETIF